MEKKDYKDTLNLPVTGFPMKADLPKREPEMLDHWEKDGLYAKMLDKNRKGPAYILHDGPPYANGNIHMGHALNKVLKDIIVKYKTMKGFRAPYVPGWDCHGLPIELQVDKKLGNKKKEISLGDKRLMCRQYAQEFIDIQREEFKRLGVFGDWENPYVTMSFDYEGRIVAEFLDFFRKGYAYVGKKPVHWCPSCVTALAEAEVEHADKTSPSVFVKFEIMDSDKALPPLASNDQKRLEELLKVKPASIVIWTTTPWTLPANKALAVNANIDYSLVSHGDSILIVASELVARLKEKDVLAQDDEIIGSVKGSSLLSLKAMHPFLKTAEDDGLRPIIEADFVSTEEGSGIVHIAPGHGQEDYEAGLRIGLEVYAPVNDYGKFQDSGVDEIENMQVFKANPVIIDMLKDKGALLGSEEIGHSYPHCWRCKKPVIFRATEQWFISMEHEGLREKALSEVEKVQWIPSWGKERIQGMIKNRPDWCISRQRSWGVPIAVFRCEGCGGLIKDEAVLAKVIEDFTANGADIWFTKDARELMPEGFKCPSCGNGSFKKEMDILDVWFDSGVSFAATLIPERGFPKRNAGEPAADMYLEGSDQHRGWFQSSLLASVGTRGHAPYRTVLTHGYTVDGKGKKMSKSIGNVVAPQELIQKSGADILRLWVSAEDYRNDIRISNEIMSRLGEAYRKIRNTAKYLLGNLHDFDGGDYSGDLTELDRWAISRLNRLIMKVTEAYDNYSFHEVYHRLYNFCVVDMSNFYLDILKDRLYTFRADSKERRAAQWVMREILMGMTGLMAPVLSFTAEEVWGYIQGDRAASVFLSEFPVARDRDIDDDLEQKWEKLGAVRNEVLKALEIKRGEKFIGNSLEASVTLHITDKELMSLVSGYENDLPTLFIVSEGKVTGDGSGEYTAADMEGLSISIEKAKGEKCQRCWNYSTTVGQDSDDSEICSRCAGAIK